MSAVNFSLLTSRGLISALRWSPSHVGWVQANFPKAAPRVATLRRLTRNLAPPENNSSNFAARLANLRLERVRADHLPRWEDVTDPAGGDQADFDACAATIDALMTRFVQLLDP